MSLGADFIGFNIEDAVKYGVLEACFLGDMGTFGVKPDDIGWSNLKWLQHRYRFASREEIILAIRHLVAEGFLVDRGL